MHPSEIPFKFEIPLEVFEKAGIKGKERRIGGIVSTDDRDRQGEKIIQSGLDFSEFLANGWFNDNHSKDTTGIVGYPEKIEQVTKAGRPAHYVEGYLLEGHEPSDKIWSLARSLQKTNRRLGFSVEGGIDHRIGSDGKTIAKARVRNVAITNSPVNTSTGLEILAKSLAYVESNPMFKSGMSAGQAVSNPGTSPGEGFPIRTESMGSDVKKQWSMKEAIRFLLERYQGLTTAQAKRILSFVTGSRRKS